MALQCVPSVPSYQDVTPCGPAGPQDWMSPASSVKFWHIPDANRHGMVAPRASARPTSSWPVKHPLLNDTVAATKALPKECGGRVALSSSTPGHSEAKRLALSRYGPSWSLCESRTTSTRSKNLCSLCCETERRDVGRRYRTSSFEARICLLYTSPSPRD